VCEPAVPADASVLATAVDDEAVSLLRMDGARPARVRGAADVSRTLTMARRN